MSIPSEDVLLQAVNHKIRRKILQIVNDNKGRSYTSLLETFDISNGKLNYHLKLLKGFIQKDVNGYYQITPLGIRTLKILEDFMQEISEEERPLIKEAYLSQKENDKSFIELQYVSGYRFKIVLLIGLYAIMMIVGIQYIPENPSFYIPFLIALSVIIVPGIVFLFRVQKKSAIFARKVDRLLEDME